LLNKSRNSSSYIEQDLSLKCTQQPAIGFFPKPLKSSIYCHTYFCKNFNIIPSMTCFPKLPLPVTILRSIFFVFLFITCLLQVASIFSLFVSFQYFTDILIKGANLEFHFSTFSVLFIFLLVPRYSPQDFFYMHRQNVIVFLRWQTSTYKEMTNLWF